MCAPPPTTLSGPGSGMMRVPERETLSQPGAGGIMDNVMFELHLEEKTLARKIRGVG